MEIDGRVAMVSGGGSGIGRSTVLALIGRGATVVVADVDEAGGRQTVDLATAMGGVALFTHCDVTKTEDLDSTFKLAIAQFGRLDIAFNNAGIGGEDLFSDSSGNWKRIIDVDLIAVIDATRLAIRTMLRAGNGGAIVNTASLIGLGPMPGAPVYAAAKAGVVNFSRSLAYLADDAGIRVNTICPELVDTPMAAGFGAETLEQLRASGGILAPEEIAVGVLELLENDVHRGAVMKVTVASGREMVEL